MWGYTAGDNLLQQHVESTTQEEMEQLKTVKKK